MLTAFRPDTPASLTIRAVIEMYLAHTERDHSPRSFYGRKLSLDAFASHCGSMLVSDAKPYHLRLWIDSHKEWRSDWTRRREASNVRVCFNWALNLGLIEDNPFKGVTCPQGERGEPMEPWEFAAMLRASAPLFRRVLIFLRFSGARPGEMAAAEWRHFDPRRACIELDRHKTAKKTRKPRRIMLHPVLLKLLAWIQRHDPDQQFIFVNAKGRRWENTAICWRLKQIRNKTCIRPETTLYGARHFFCTQAVLAGVDIATVAALAGHERITTTQHYLHVAGKTDHLQAAVKQVFTH